MPIDFFEIGNSKEEDQEVKDFFEKHGIIKWELVTRIASPAIMVVEYKHDN